MTPTALPRLSTKTEWAVQQIMIVIVLKAVPELPHNVKVSQESICTTGHVPWHL